MADKFSEAATSRRPPMTRRQSWLPIIGLLTFGALLIMLLKHTEPAMVHHLSKLTPNRPQRGMVQRPVKVVESGSGSGSGSGSRTGTGKVKLEAHIMSKCPDAKDCLREMVVPTMEKVSSLVDFNLSFIGSVDPKDNTVQCKHGPTECLGNTILLCAQSLYPTQPIVSLGFANCLVSSYQQIPERSLVESCALEHGVDFKDLNECISDDARGDQMLRQSVNWSKSEGVVYSCTVRVEGKTWCVRDGGVWKDCEGGSKVEDLVGRIEELARN